jgi:hypothetical protein
MMEFPGVIREIETLSREMKRGGMLRKKMMQVNSPDIITNVDSKR